jgi:hypothetical protein
MKTKLIILAIAYALCTSGVEASTTSTGNHAAVSKSSDELATINGSSGTFDAEVFYSRISSKIMVVCEGNANRPFLVQLLNEKKEIVYAGSGTAEKDFTKDIDVAALPEGIYSMQIISMGESTVREIEIR